MKIGVPKEVKPGEGRVSLMPRQVKTLVDAGHAVQVERDAAALLGVGDDEYARAGAVLSEDGAAIYQNNELIVKVKEIMPPEYCLLRPDHILFTNIHSAALPDQLNALMESGLTAIAAEETHEHGSPNSLLAGEVGAFEGLRLAFSPTGGSGRHFFDRFAAAPVRALVMGLGGVGQGALRTLLAFDVSVAGFDLSPEARQRTQQTWKDANFKAHDIGELADHLGDADVIYNCVLWPKEREDHLISREALKALKPTCAVIDISCDPGGAIQTSRATTWADPVYVEEGIRHFCVDNIPGAVPVASSAGYAASIVDHVQQIADAGALAACRSNKWLARGLTCHKGELILAEAGRVQQRPFTPVDDFLKR